MRRLIAFLSDRSGATAIEYGVLGALVAVAIIGGVSAVAVGLENTWGTVSDTFTAAIDE